MVDITDKESADGSAIPIATETEISIKGRTPRSAWWDFFLHLFTFGIYTAFYIVKRIKEIDSLSERNFAAYLWFFVPSFAICQPFAFLKLGDALAEIEDKHGIVANRSRYTVAWLTSFIASIYSAYSMNQATPIWLDLIILILWAASITIALSRINNLKRQLSSLEFEGKPRYTFFEWLVLLIFSPLFAVMLIGSVETLSMDKNEAYDNNDTYVDSSRDISVKFLGDGWHRVDIGTYSEGGSLIEFTSPVEDGYVIIYQHNKDININQHLSGRREWIGDGLKNIGCKENRGFIAGTLDIYVKMTCEGSWWGDPYLETVVMLEKGNSIYEYIGVLSTPNKSFKMWSEKFTRMASEFSVL